MPAAELDKKDLAILQALDSNARVAFTELAKKTRLSKDTVQYRVRRLESAGIITGYWAYLDTGNRYRVYKILIKNKSLGSKERQSLVQYLLEQSFISWFADTEGNYDYVLTAFADNDDEFMSFVENLLGRFGTYFQERHILKSIGVTITNEKYLYDDGRLIYGLPIDFRKPRPAPDDIDAELLRLLSLDCRASYAELAAKVSLSAEAVAYRMRHSLAKHILRHKVRINHSALGYAYYHVFLTLQDQTRSNELVQFYTAHPCCVATMRHLGYHDLHLEFVLPSDQIDSVMDELRNRFGQSLASYELLHIRKEHVMHMLR